MSVFTILIFFKEYCHLNEFYTMMFFMLLSELFVVTKEKEI